jgi:metallo-beta-lactamase family protein
MIEVEFYGATGEVTGSCHILRVGDRRILLECGMIQGGRQKQDRNREDFPFAAGEIDAVVLSHAHIDHSGRLPLLVQRGYSGPIYAQQVTRDLCRIMLEDSARLAESDAASENRRRERKGLPPVTPLYTPADAEQALANFVPLPYRERREILPGIHIRYQDAGHILGAAIVEVWARDGDTERKLVFSGDLGQYDTPILRDPAAIEDADMVIMESTYGDRFHRDRAATEAEIAGVITSASHRRGNILIPAFAVGRTQEILYMFARNFKAWGLDAWRIFLDSPMAIRTSAVYWDNPGLYDEEAAMVREGLRGMPLLPNLTLSESADDSRAINRVRSGAIVIAGSGMCEGGRILHHLKHNIWRPECHVLIVGYQANGTLGRRLVDGQAYVRIYHEAMRVRAQIHTVGGLSAHGDQHDLARWYAGFRKPPPAYLVHGEPTAAAALSERLLKAGAPRAIIAERGLRVNLADPAGKRAATHH